jgi:CheY-like chemotaxis protein
MAKILVVDCDARNLRLAATVLEKAGHEVLSAKDGTAGIEAAVAHAPDLVLMDVQMPDMDGVTALKRLRTEPRCASMKVVALTALAMNGDRERLLAAGFDGYFEKPIRYKEFLANVAVLLKEAAC